LVSRGLYVNGAQGRAAEALVLYVSTEITPHSGANTIMVLSHCAFEGCFGHCLLLIGVVYARGCLKNSAKTTMEIVDADQRPGRAASHGLDRTP
jgi:hypothetical protein